MATLNEKIWLARALFGTDRTDAPSVNRISGTATADSSDGTVTVQLDDGDVIELGTIGSVRSGQTVTVHVQGNSAQVIAAEGWGDALQESVDEAVEVANATGQHFWDDTNGAHVTEVTREDWETQPSGFNALWNSLGLLFRKALDNLVAITQSAVTFYDGQGNAASNVTASFGSSGSQIGRSGDSHLTMDYRSLSLTDKGGSEYFHVEDMRDATGYADMVVTATSDGTSTGSQTIYMQPPASPVSSVSVTVSDGSGGAVTVEPDGAYVRFASPPTRGALITVSYKTDSDTAKSYTFGSRASGSGVGASSSVDGIGCEASGYVSTARGARSVASGPYSRSDGIDTVASGICSHASGDGTVASWQYQTVIGRYNAEGDKAFIIGNGLSDFDRGNAFTVGWNGLVTMGGTTFQDMFVHETVTSGNIGSIAAGSAAWVTAWSVAKTGYKAIAITGYYINGGAALSVYCMRFSDATHVQFAVRNNGSTAVGATAKIEAQILYVKAL